MRSGFGLAVFAVVIASCSSHTSEVVAVTATDTRCRVPRTAVRAGNASVRVANRAHSVTDVYVYDAGGQVKGEIPDVGRGATRSLAVDFAAGSYSIVCKTGANGQGIRSAVSVSGTGGRRPPRPTATISVAATDYRYHGLRGRVITAGSIVAIRLRNDAPVENHELEIFGPDGQAVGEIGPTAPSKTGRVVLRFDQPGVYEFVCGVEDHEERGMRGRFRVR